MPLISYRFVVFAALTLVLYNAVPSRHRAPMLLLASYLFYADASVIQLLLLFAITAATFVAGRVVATRHERLPFVVAIAAILAPLLGFKAAPLLSTWLVSASSTTNLGLAGSIPLGLSFYTLQAISYVTDVRRNGTAAERSLTQLALYLAFFPRLVAGPIERAKQLLPQLHSLQRSNAGGVYAGLKLVLWGFFCKLVVADNIGSIVDQVLIAPRLESGTTLALTFSLYAFQIYFDFLGYTNIAIGVARCFNVHLNINFDAPYLATSLRDFWRRWHISLSSWFRDYVYIPLGGQNTRGPARLGLILLVFLASGLWHGAALHFAAWGAIHGGAYWMEERLRVRLGGPESPGCSVRNTARRWSQRIATFGVVTLAWVFFRLSDLPTIELALARMTLVDRDIAYASLNAVLMRRDSLWFILMTLTALVLDSSPRFRAALLRIPESPRNIVWDLACVNWLTVTLFLFGDLGVRDFTYQGF